MVEFGELVTVDPWQAWPHEANDFTPWMVQPENLGKLSREVGLPALELEGREVREGSLRADIIAVVPQDDRKVLIENQLYHADFDHLGRTLAYANAFNANIVVWVAGGFSPDHLAAFRWLNEHTKDEGEYKVDFFAVQVKVFRIGDSLMAPKFEVLERPNNFVRETRARWESRELSGFPKQCHDFWEFYRERHPDDLALREGFRGHTFSFSIGEVRTSIFLQPSVRKVGIYIRPRNPNSEEAAQSQNRCWYALKERGRGSDWPDTLPVDITDREKWDEAAAFIHDTLPYYREVLELERDGKLENPALSEPAETQS